jgi:hypothetical protein
MKPRTPYVVLAALLLATAACQDSSAPVSSSPLSTSEAFSTLPLGFSNVQSTFGNGTDSSTTEWTPNGSGSGQGHHGGGNGMMCGGFGGSAGVGFGLGRGLFSDTLPGTCAFDAASGRVSCEPETRNGLTIQRSAAYTDATGQVQQGFDSTTTEAINVRTEVTGTKIQRDGDTTTVQHSSDRTITGLAQGSAERTVNGASSGTETTTGSDSAGAYSGVRVIGDTIQKVVLPVTTSDSTYPTAGTIIRSMQVTAAYAGKTPESSTRREVVIFDGSNTASVVITKDGTTQNCTLPLPKGILSCSQ